MNHNMDMRTFTYHALCGGLSAAIAAADGPDAFKQMLRGLVNPRLFLVGSALAIAELLFCPSPYTFAEFYRVDSQNAFGERAWEGMIAGFKLGVFITACQAISRSNVIEGFRDSIWRNITSSMMFSGATVMLARWIQGRDFF